jgi:hypothetical protein
MPFSDYTALKPRNLYSLREKPLVTAEILQIYSLKPKNAIMLNRIKLIVDKKMLVKMDFSFHQTFLVFYLLVFPVML